MSLFSLLYQSGQSVFSLTDLSVYLPDATYDTIKSTAAYYVRTKQLVRIRQWRYALWDRNIKEFACKLYTPSYISFETILAESGQIFQYDSTIYLASYLSRSVKVLYQGSIVTLQYRKLTSSRLMDTQWLVMWSTYTYATPQRARQDMLYLKPDFYFDRS